jgi:hypothetical protein
MRKALILSGALSLVASALPAQTVRWNDRSTATWQDSAPRVRVVIEGSRSVPYGAPMRVRFEVSDNAYVTVVRVDDQGRMTILFPYSRTQRAAVRGGTVQYVRNPRLGNGTAFLANDRMGGGYIFALASFAPLDFSRFENRDYDRIGGYSAFTVANRNSARRPDVFIDRFAAAVLWDKDTAYDYDVDYYFPAVRSYSSFNTYAMCASMFDEFGASTFGTSLLWDWNSSDFIGYPYRSMCRSYYQNMRCLSSIFFYSYSTCNINQVIAQGPTAPPTGGQPTDSGKVPNEGVVRGGMQAPTPIPVIPGAGDEPPPVERRGGRFDQARADDLDNITSIPARATRKMKEDDARRMSGSATSSSPGRFDSATDRPEKNRTASTDASTRVDPPSREPTKAKATGEPRRETGRDTYGSTRSGSVPRTTSGPDRVSRPAEKTGASTGSTGSSGSAGTFTGSTTERKKPPQ